MSDSPTSKAAQPLVKVTTGISGLDDILDGGLAPNRLYLIEGMPGSGKTTLALQFLSASRVAGERSLYVTLSETEEELEAVVASHGLTLDGIDVFELASAESAFSAGREMTLLHPWEVELGETIKLITDEVERFNPSRVVFDSLSEMRLLAQDPLRYRRQILALKQFFAGRKATVLFLDDLTGGDGRQDLQLHSISHGVITLERLTLDFGTARRRLQVQKMRGSDFRAGFHDLTIRRAAWKCFLGWLPPSTIGVSWATRCRAACPSWTSCSVADRCAEGIESRTYPTLAGLRVALDDTAGAVLLADEALFRGDLNALAVRLTEQPPWSDLPFIVLTQAGIAARRQMAELNLPGKLGNVMFLERPLAAFSLVSAVRSALRARQRQRQVRDYLVKQVGAAEREAALLEARVQERTAALEETERERQKIAAALGQAQKMEAVGQLTGGLAHDFNNMLTGIVGSLELLQARLAQGRIEQLGRYISMAQQGAQRAAALTQRLLAFSRQQALDPKPTSLNTLVAGMAELIRSTVGPGITIGTVLQKELWPTLCDPHQLENALLNLCINARDAMPEGGQLTIEAENRRLTPAEAAILPEARPGEFAMLCITDTGCGMPPEVIARVFDPFFTTKPLGQGTGLGLSMIYGFVQQSGGHVQISSRVGRGTTVRLYLPRHDGAEQASLREGATATPAQATAQGTVLVVDDEPPIRLLISEVLSDLGYAVQVAWDGPSALQTLSSLAEVDLLVTDVGMPGRMNGRQLADAAREQRPGLKVLFITGYADTILPGKGLLGTGMAVMTKPFAISDLVAKIHIMMADDPIQEAQ